MGVGAVVPARVDVHVDVVEVADVVEQVNSHGLGHVVALAHREVLIYHGRDRGGQAVPDPAGLLRTHPLHTVQMGRSRRSRARPPELLAAFYGLAGTSSLSIALICCRSSGPSTWPWVEAACSAAA
jgi:hypothetical protein